MTKSQLLKKIDIARRSGSVYIGDGCTLYFHGDGWSIEYKDGNTVDTCTHSPERYFDYLIG